MTTEGKNWGDDLRWCFILFGIFGGLAGPAFGATDARRGLGFVDVIEGDHFGEALFAFFIESTFLHRSFRIIKGAEEHVPERDIGVVIRVVVFLVVDPV